MTVNSAFRKENGEYDENKPFYNYQKDLVYQLHLWVLLIANTGVRPPDTEKNLLRWDSYEIVEKDSPTEHYRFIE